MAQLSEVVAYQSSVSDVWALAISELFAFWRSLSNDDPEVMAGQVREFVPEMVDTYQPVSAEVGANFYDEVRAAASVSVPHSTVLADPPTSDAVQNRLSWVVAPLFRRDSNGARVIDLDAAISRSVSEVQLEVANGARDTINLNVEQDRGHPRFARHASANACAFCILMALRGAVYRTAEAAGSGNKFHAHCHCVAYPVFPDEDDESPPYVATWDAAYQDARKKLKKPTTGDILALMRSSLNAA